MTLYVGIDPGLHGAIAAYSKNADFVLVHGLPMFDIPVFDLTVNGKKRQKLDMHKLQDYLVNLTRRSANVRAFVEDVHSMPKQGVASSFKFGFVAGAIQQAVVDTGMELNLVPPQVWKRRYGLTADKDAARAKASMLLPAHAHLWPLKKHDGRAEAALLALYGARYGG